MRISLRPVKKIVLTERERQALQLAAYGLDNQEIADTLLISIRTVQYHLENVRKKYKVNTRVKACVLAIQDGLIRCPCEVK